MSNQNTLQALADRCKQATGPDRELDARIYILVTGGSAADADYAATAPEVTCMPPLYTASLDAALTLVPDGWAVELVQALSGSPWHAKLRGGSALVPIIGAAAAAPALALCAAALRARAAIDTPHDP